MNDRASFFDLSDQPPIIQLVIAFLMVNLAGTLLFCLFLLAGSLIFRTNLFEMVPIPSGTEVREVSILKYIQISQQIAMFVIPAIVTANLLNKKKKSFLKMNRIPGSIPIVMVIMLALLIIPVISYTGVLNSRMNLPDWLSGVKDWMRTKEDAASDLTSLLIKSSRIGDLVINILILAIIPAIAEEMIFRGILQQILCRIFRSDHIAIWITAIFFSAIHLQFFGFLPRLLLGLCFGYLFFWTGNLWIAILAHFINNIVPVLMSHFIGWSELNDKALNMAEKQVLLPLVPALLSIGILYYFWSEYRNNLVGDA